jgi:hypothetical protein
MTTYVLGAGASKHAGYPLCSELWTEMKKWAEMHSREVLLLKLKEVEQRHGPIENVERLFTDLDSGQSAFQELGDSQRRSLSRDLRLCIAEIFVNVARGSVEAGLYRKLAKSINPGDIVVTFNYDTSIESNLADAGKFTIKGYGFPVAWDTAKTRVLVLKLHGSINWLPTINGALKLDGPFVDNRSRLLACYPSEVLDERYSPNSAHVDPSVTMVLPTLRKRFEVPTSIEPEWGWLYEGLWQQAREWLLKSERLVIIGYSMPEADERANDFLLGTPNKNVVLNVCCYSNTPLIECRFREAGFKRIERLPDPTFDGFLSKQEGA